MNESKVNNVSSFNYKANYGAQWGFSITDLKSNNIIYTETGEGGEWNTKSFGSKRDLESYADNGLVGDIVFALIGSATDKINYYFNSNHFDVRLEVSIIDDKEKAYSEINTASEELKKIIESKIFEKEKIDAIATIYTKHLANVNFEDKKAAINKKVAKALVNNSCVAYFLTENYAEMQKALTAGTDKDKSKIAAFYEDKPSFRIYGYNAYIGPYSSYNRNFGDEYMIIDYVDYCNYEVRIAKKMEEIKM
jgi:hypothetical protein